MKRIFTLTVLLLHAFLLSLAQPTNIVISPVSATSLSFSWTASGTGNNVLVIIRNGASNYRPSNGTLPSTNLAFPADAAGTDLDPAAGQIAAAVYSGAATTSGTVTGLAANTTYFIHVYEYTAGPNYITGSVAGNPTSFIYFTSSGPWTPPSQITTANVQVWGAGGGGGGGTNGGNRAGGGGGGGTYTSSTGVAVTPGTPITVTIGAVGTSGNGTTPTDAGPGGTSTFASSSPVSAVGGTAGSTGSGSTNVNGPGGVATAGLTYGGGAGADGVAGTSGGAGGGGAGTTGTGGDATGTTGGTGGTGGGGTGAAGVTSLNNGNNGTQFAAGGGGAFSTSGNARNGGTGGPGLVIVSYLDITPPTLTLTLPVTSSTTSSTNVTYTTTENLGSATISWAPTAGSDVTTHTQTLTLAELAAPGQTNHTLTSNPALVSGSTYTVTFAGSDIAGNAGTPIVVTGFLFDNTPPTVSSIVPIVTGPNNNIIPRTGTITATTGSTAVTGVGTFFTTELGFGSIIKDGSGNVIGTVQSITDDTDLVLVANGAVAVTGGAYTVGLFYTVTFSEAVTLASITSADFTLTATGGAVGSIGTPATSNGGSSSNKYIVPVTITTAGNVSSLRLDKTANSYSDLAGNSSITPFTTGTVDNTDITAPAVSTSSPIAATTNGNISRSGTITSSTGSTAVVGVGTTFNTQLVAGSIIKDGSGNVIGTVQSITDPLNLVLTANAVTAVTGGAYTMGLYYTVIFSESVQSGSISAADFVLTATGSAAGTIGTISPTTGNSVTYIVNVNPTVGGGTLRLDKTADPYVDIAGNSSTTTFVGGTVSIIDLTPPTLTLTLPVASTLTNSTNVTYTVSENLGVGTITWTPTAGSDVTTHVQSLAGGELNTPGQTNHTLTSNPALVSGSTYTVTFAGSDPAGNAATPITVTGVAFDNTPPVASAPTNTAQRLKGGAVSTSTVQSTKAGNIYLVLHLTAAGTQAQINTAITAKNAFLAQGSAVAATPYTVTVPGAGAINDGLYDIVAVDNAGNVSAVVGGWLTIDNTAPAVQTLGAVLTVGGRVIANYWNSTNTSLTVVVPLNNADVSLDNGSVQIQVGGTPIGTSGLSTISNAQRTAGTKTVTINAADLEAASGFSAGATLTFTAVVTDVAGNATTDNASATTLKEDQIAPTVSVNPTEYSNDGGGPSGGGRNNHEVIQFIVSEPLFATSLGTITATNGSKAVTGVGTSFLNLPIGTTLYKSPAVAGPAGIIGTVASASTNTALQLNANDAGGYSGNYSIGLSSLLSLTTTSPTSTPGTLQYINDGSANTPDGSGSFATNSLLVYVESSNNSSGWLSSTNLVYAQSAGGAAAGNYLYDAAGNEMGSFSLSCSAGASSTVGSATSGVATSPINNGSTGKVVLAFSIVASSGTPNVTALNFTTSTDPTLLLTNYKVYTNSGSDNFGTATNLGLAAPTVTASAVTFSGISVGLSTTVKYFYLVADVDNFFYSASPTIQFTITADPMGITATGAVGGTDQTGTNYTLADVTPPVILSVTNTVNPIYEGALMQTVKVVYNEPMNTATIPNISISGANWGAQTAVGWSTTTFTNDTYTATFTHTATQETVLSATTSVPAAGNAHDWGGNANTASGTSAAFVLDNQEPTVITGQSSVTPSTINITGPALTIKLVFSETMNTTVTPTIVFSPANANFTPGAGVWSTTNVSNDTYTIVYTHNATAEEIASTTVSVSGEKDSHGNVQSTPTPSPAFLIDTKRPTVVSINRSSSQFTKGPTVTYTVVFSEAVSSVDEADFTPVAISGTVSTGNVLAGSVNTTDNITYTVSVTNLTGDGNTRLDLAASPTINDQNGNALTAPHTGDQIYSIDNTPPTVVSVNVDPALLNAWSVGVKGTTPALHGNTIDYIVTFSEPVTGLYAVTALDGTPRDFNGIFTPSAYTGAYANFSAYPLLTNGNITAVIGTPTPSSGPPSTQWVITANYVAGTGTFELDFDPTANQAIGSGTITTSVILPVVTGIGTHFLTEIIPGNNLYDLNHNNIGMVQSVVSDTQLNLTTFPLHPESNASYLSSLPYISQVADQAGNLISPGTDFTGQSYTISLPQPTNPVAAITAPLRLTTSITVQWTNPTGGSQEATHYLVMAKPSVGGSYPAVADGTYVPNATLVSSGGNNVVLNVPKTTPAGSTQSISFPSLSSGVNYDFIIYPYTLSPLDSIADASTATIDFNTTTPATIPTIGTPIGKTGTLSLTSTPTKVSSIANASGSAVSVLSYNLTDDGSNPAIDNAPFKFSQLVVSSGNVGVDWTQALGGAILTDGTNTQTVDFSVTPTALTSTSITFSAINSAVNNLGYVPDNSTGTFKTYTLKVWLKNTLGVADNSSLVFIVNNASFTYDNTSNNQLTSQLLTAPAQSVNSGSNTIDIYATKLVFVTNPQSQIGVGINFSQSTNPQPRIEARDINNNLDLDYAATFNVLPAAGVVTSLTNFTAGVLTLSTFNFSTAGLRTITISGNSTGAPFNYPALTGVTSTGVTAGITNETTITLGPVPTPSTISSLSTALTGAVAPQVNAVQNFDFTVTDDSGANGLTYTDNDNLPTIITQITIGQGGSNDPVLVDWTKAIAVAQLSDGVGTPITGVIGGTSIVFTIPGASTLRTIADGTSKTYTLTITLLDPVNSAISDLIDNKDFGFSVVTAGMSQAGVPANTSSTVQSAQIADSGPGNKVVVLATQQTFTTEPAASYLVNVPLSAQSIQPVVKALDVNGNRDLDYGPPAVPGITTTTTVVGQSGQPTTLSAVPNGGLISGATFGAMQFTTIGSNAKITVHSTVNNAVGGTVSDAVSSLFNVTVGSATTITSTAVIGNVPSTTNASPGVNVFSFKVNEDAATPPDDGNPTLISQVTITQSNATTNNTNSAGLSDWTQAIAGAQLSDGTHTSIGVVNATSIVFSSMITLPTPVASDIGYIQDGGPNGLVGSAKTYTLSLWLKTSLGGVLPITIDNLKFGFDVTTSGIITNLNGTSLTGGQQALSTSGNTVNVVASKINYLTAAPVGTPAVPPNTSAFSAVPSLAFPSSAGIYVKFENDTLPIIGAEAVDANGVRDLDYTGKIQTFSVANSLTYLNGPVTGTDAFVQGTYTFNTGFEYTTGLNQDGSITMSASGGTNPTLNTPALTTSTPINIFSSTDSYVYFDTSIGAQTFSNFVNQQANPTLPNVADATIATMAQLILSDGGAANFASTGLHNAVTDLDNAFTRISSITFAITGAGANDLRLLALYDGTGKKISSDMPAAASVTFNSLSIKAPDNQSTTFTIRGSFKSSPITDGDQVQFQIAGVTWSAGSQLYNYNGGSGPYFGGVNSGSISLTDKVDVVATSLDFTTEPNAYAGINQPIDATTCTSLPYTGVVTARDKFKNVDTDFNYTYSLSAIASPSLATPKFTNGVLDLVGMKYTSIGSGVHPNGTLTVISNGLNSNTISSANSIPCSRVDVIDVGASKNTNSVTGSTNLKGGTSPVIFGADITSNYMVSTYNSDLANEPSLTSLTFSFDVPYQAPGYTSFTGFSVYESTNGLFAGALNVVTSYGATVATASSTSNSNLDLVTVNFPTARPLYTSAGQPTPTRSYFLVANVSPTATNSNPKITPELIDTGYGNNFIAVTQGSSSANVMGKQFGFASTKPPSLVGTSCSPYVGQLNVNPAITEIDLAFDIAVLSFDGTALLIDKTNNNTQVAMLTAINGVAPPASNLNNLATRTAATVNPIRFKIPTGTLLLPDHIYYVTLAQGTFTPTGNGGLGSGTGISDDQLNLYGGITYNGTMYFKISSTIPPNMVTTTSSSYNVSPTVASINASFDAKGTGYYLILDHSKYNTVTNKPTTAQIKNQASYPVSTAVITSGNFVINQVSPNLQFFNVIGNWALSTTYDVWIYAENDALPTPFATNQPYGFVPASPPNPATYPIGAAGPTFSFTQPTGNGVPIYQICPNSYSILSQPIIITETAANTWNAGSVQDFNVTLPSGFDYDITYSPTVQLVGADFNGTSATTSFINSTLLNVKYNNSGTASVDRIIISNMRVIANSTAAAGDIGRFAGSGLPDYPSNTPPSGFAKIGANTLAQQTFTNSYTQYNNFASTIDLSNVVTSIPDNFIDQNLAATNNNAIRLIPTIIPGNDYNASFFSGAGVTDDVLSLSTVAKNTAFDITMTHTDLNGCFLTQTAQYIVYDHTNIIPVLTDNGGTPPSYGPNICLTNSNFKTPSDVSLGTAVSSPYPSLTLNFGDISGYQLDSMIVRVPPQIKGFSKIPTATSQIIFDSTSFHFWPTQLSKMMFEIDSSKYVFTPPFRYYRSYKWDYSQILNIGIASGGAVKNPYDNFLQHTPTNSSNFAGGHHAFYTGGSLGVVDFIGKFQSTADQTIYQPLVQQIELFVPAVPVIEAIGQSATILGADTTYVFCQQGNDIVFNGYPAASPGKSTAYYSLYDDATNTVLYNGVTGLPSAAGFTDNANSNGTGTLKPASVAFLNNYNRIRVEYTYQDNNSPCAGKGVFYIKIAPNPIADFSFASVVAASNIPASGPSAYCATNNIIFTATTVPAGNSGYLYTWNFQDASSSSPAPSNVNTASHTFSKSNGYNVTLDVVSDFGCPSIPKAVAPAAQGVTPGSKALPVIVGDIPTPVFSFTGNCVGDNMNFIDASTTPPGANSHPAQWDWNFGDLGTGTGATPFHIYATPMSWKVTLSTTTDLGCRDTVSQYISQLPVAVYPPNSNAFQESFNNDNGGGWIVLNLNGGDPAAGVTSWVNDNSKWTISSNYNANEKSALYSACLDLSSIPRPAIQFDGYFGFRTGDGMVLQYSTDTKNIQDHTKNWNTLGTTTDGLDWYSNFGVPSNPGTGYANASNPNGFGWADSIGQEAPKHELETVGAVNRVILRWAFNSGNSASTSTGAWIDNVRVGSRTRTILFENFTTANPAPASDVTTNNIFHAEADTIAKFVQANLNSTQLVNINYHVGTLGKDPFNLDDPADASARALYYGVTNIPYAYFDGEHKYPNLQYFKDWGKQAYDLQTLNLAKADFLDSISSVKTAISTNNSDGSIQVSVNFTPRINLPVSGVDGNTILQVAVLEKSVTTPPVNGGSVNTGETQFAYVLKKMIPDATGTRLAPLVAGDTILKLGVPVTTAAIGDGKPIKWMPTKLYSNTLTVVVFLQNEQTREVYQADYFDVPVPSTVVTAIEPLTPDNINVYPNPADKEFVIELPHPATENLTLRVANQLGQFTEMGTINEGEQTRRVSTQGLAEGVYILQLGSNGNALRTKIVVVHK